MEHTVTCWAGDLYFLIRKEGRAAFFILTHTSKKNPVHRTQARFNEELKMMIGMTEENSLTTEISWRALSEFVISSSPCWFPLPNSFLDASVAFWRFSHFSFSVWIWQKCKCFRRLKISLGGSSRERNSSSPVSVIWDKFRLSLLQIVLLSHCNQMPE